jgi:D-alanyl-lipoteichoic acid acyltransferase DltB (MBOAT superfamily)
MLFNSITFILFFVYILIVHYSLLPWKLKKGHLLLGSYVFYAAWNPPFVILLFLSTFVDWNLAKKIHACQSAPHRKYWLWLSLIFNLGLLSIFKYSGFLIENFESLLTGLGMDVKFSDPGFILPMGISFYTFQTLSYTLDIYYKKLKPHHGFLDYALFVSFFPQLVAGPIVRAKVFLPQLKSQTRINFNTFSTGISLFIIGIFAKTVLADAFFAPLVNPVFVDNVQPDLLSSWLTGLFFYGQIFCDFAGYSLCAIGTALCLGFTLPYNFNSPFAAIGFSDFWRRWHISLSSWLRDYIYIPLGGNRFGSFNSMKNLMITMLLGGLWHGAAWTYVAWGGLHGLYLITERWLKYLFSSFPLFNLKIMKFILMLITFIFVMFGMVLFRSDNLLQAYTIIMGMFLPQGNQELIKWDLWTQLVTLSFIIMFLCQWFYRNTDMDEVVARMPVLVRAFLLSIAMILILLSSGDSDAFIYFQF